MDVRFEPIDEHHLAAVQALAEDPSIGATSQRTSPYPPDGAREWFEHSKALEQEGGCFDFAILQGDEVVGVCGVRVFPERKSGFIGFWIGKPFWRRGFASQAARFLVDYSFSQLKLDELTSNTLVKNRVSAHILEKAGFHLTGVTCNEDDRWGRESVMAQYRLRRDMWDIGSGI